MEVVSNVTAPAQKHATDAAVYTALFFIDVNDNVGSMILVHTVQWS